MYFIFNWIYYFCSFVHTILIINIFQYHFSWIFCCKFIYNHIPINDFVLGIWLSNMLIDISYIINVYRYEKTIDA